MNSILKSSCHSIYVCKQKPIALAYDMTVIVMWSCPLITDLTKQVSNGRKMIFIDNRRHYHRWSTNYELKLSSRFDPIYDMYFNNYDTFSKTSPVWKEK